LLLLDSNCLGQQCSSITHFNLFSSATQECYSITLCSNHLLQWITISRNDWGQKNIPLDTLSATARGLIPVRVAFAVRVSSDTLTSYPEPVDRDTCARPRGSRIRSDQTAHPLLTGSPPAPLSHPSEESEREQHPRTLPPSPPQLRLPRSRLPPSSNSPRASAAGVLAPGSLFVGRASRPGSCLRRCRGGGGESSALAKQAISSVFRWRATRRKPRRRGAFMG
jgi:hypothetical protein